MNRCLVLFVCLESLRKRPIQTFEMASQSACNMRLTGMEDTTELLEKQLALEMSKMTLEEALTLVRAFSHYLTLMGVAETHHRVQKSRSMAHLSKSCDDFFNQLIHGGVSPDELYNNVCIQEVEIVTLWIMLAQHIRISQSLCMTLLVHLAPGSKFDFQKYIKRSLQDDFKTIVGVSPVLWASFVIFLLLNVDGWLAWLWASLIPLIIILAVETKLQAILSRMALDISERHAVVQGIPLVQASNKYFWFGLPQLVLHLIHFALFQVSHTPSILCTDIRIMVVKIYGITWRLMLILVMLAILLTLEGVRGKKSLSLSFFFLLSFTQTQLLFDLHTQLSLSLSFLLSFTQTQLLFDLHTQQSIFI